MVEEQDIKWSYQTAGLKQEYTWLYQIYWHQCHHAESRRVSNCLFTALWTSNSNSCGYNKATMVFLPFYWKSEFRLKSFSLRTERVSASPTPQELFSSTSGSLQMAQSCSLSCAVLSNTHHVLHTQSGIRTHSAVSVSANDNADFYCLQL